MKRKSKMTVYYIVMALVAVIAVVCFEKTFWRIITPLLIAFIAWMIYEFDHAIEIDDEEMNY